MVSGSLSAALLMADRDSSKSLCPNQDLHTDHNRLKIGSYSGKKSLIRDGQLRNPGFMLTREKSSLDRPLWVSLRAEPNLCAGTHPGHHPVIYIPGFLVSETEVTA